MQRRIPISQQRIKATMKLLLKELIDDIAEYENIYIFGFGLAGRWLSVQIDSLVKGFIDSDLKKTGQIFEGIEVFSLDQVRNLLHERSVIILSVIDLQDVLPALTAFRGIQSIPLGKYLEPGNGIKLRAIKESGDFLDYSLTAVKEYHEAYYDATKLFLRSVDLMITEKCTLRCKDCSNLMQYYTRPKNIEIEEVLNDFATIANNVDHIFEVRLIGGEPFMNKQIYDIIAAIVESSKISRVVIYSNAMIPFKPSALPVLQHPKVVLSLTDYGALAKNTASNVKILDDASVPYRLHPPENWTDSGVIFDFKRTDQENQRIFDSCCGKNLLTVSNGKLYRCPFSANADRLSAIPFDSSNSTDLAASKDALRSFVKSTKAIAACNYCKGRSFDAPEIEAAVQVERPIPYRMFPVYNDV